MKKMKLTYLKKLYSDMDRYNKMLPFPPYDTDYVSRVKQEIDDIEESDIDYDSLSVEACKYCNSLHITMEDDETNVCNKCFSVNELTTFKNIHEYTKYLETLNK